MQSHTKQININSWQFWIIGILTSIVIALGVTFIDIEVSHLIGMDNKLTEINERTIRQEAFNKGSETDRALLRVQLTQIDSTLKLHNKRLDNIEY